MAHESSNVARNDTLSWALCFEVGLGVIALGLGWLLDVWPAQKLHWPIRPYDLFLGLISALPPLALMLGLIRVPWRPIKTLRELVHSHVLPIFQGLSLLDLALISIAAGWGEELLFRGFMQTGLESLVGPWGAIAAASLLFGLVHFLSPAYFVLAAAISIYLGVLFWHFDSLWIPIIAHATYDFLVLAFLKRTEAAPVSE